MKPQSFLNEWDGLDKRIGLMEGKEAPSATPMNDNSVSEICQASETG